MGDIDGLVATSALELGQNKKLRAKMNEINDFAENLKSRAERDFVESRDALVALHKLFSEKLEFKYKLEFLEPTSKT